MRQKMRMKRMMERSVLLVAVFPGVLPSHVVVESVVVLVVSLGLLGVEEVVRFLPMMVLVMSPRARLTNEVVLNVCHMILVPLDFADLDSIVCL
jgi:hypothetical protein